MNVLDCLGYIKGILTLSSNSSVKYDRNIVRRGRE